MKRNICLISFLLIVMFLIISYNIKTINIKHSELKKQASEYLYEKYSKQAVFESEPNYYDSLYFFNNVHFKNENIYFQVRYIVPSSNFEDDYLEIKKGQGD